MERCKLLLGLLLLLVLSLGEVEPGTWQQCASDVLAARAWHSSVYSPLRKVVLVYGGHNNIEDVVYDDLYAYDPELQAWDLLLPTNVPPGRYGHSAAIVGEDMIVVGGFNQTHVLSDVWLLNLETLQWSQLPDVSSPLGGHSAVVSRTGVMYVFGGTTDTGVRSNNLYALEEGVWRLASGEAPSGRWRHSAVLVGDNIWVFGGQDATNSPDNALFRYNINADEWQAFNTTVPPRYGQTSIATPMDSAMLVYGGQDDIKFLDDVWEFTFASSEWEALQNNGLAPSRRAGHSATVWRGSSVDNYMFICGGVATLGPKNDAFQLNLGKLPPVEARTTVHDNNNVVLLFESSDSPNHKLIPKDVCTQEVRDELHLSFKFVEMSERTPSGSTVRTVAFPSSGFTLVQGSDSAKSQFNFATTIPAGTVGVEYSLFSNMTYLEYGNVTLQNLPGTNKWNIKLRGWRFMNELNRLELRVKLAVDEKAQVITSVSSGVRIPSQRITRYSVSATETRLTVDLADFVLTDGGLDKPVHHRFERADLLMLSLPYFQHNLTYDPNFGLLIGGQDKRRGEDPCGGGGFDMWWLISLVAAAVILPTLTIVGGLVYILHQRKKAAQRALIQERIRAFTKVEEERATKRATITGTIQETPASVV